MPPIEYIITGPLRKKRPSWVIHCTYWRKKRHFSQYVCWTNVNVVQHYITVTLPNQPFCSHIPGDYRYNFQKCVTFFILSDFVQTFASLLFLLSFFFKEELFAIKVVFPCKFVSHSTCFQKEQSSFLERRRVRERREEKNKLTKCDYSIVNEGTLAWEPCRMLWIWNQVCKAVKPLPYMITIQYNKIKSFL